MKAKIYDMTGAEVGTQELPEGLFDVKVAEKLVSEAVRIQEGNARHPYAHTKTRSEVRGGGRKPWRQKGTGRARHGSIRSPLWKGGGVTFGPRNDRNYTRRMNVKAKRKALTMVLTDKAQQEKVVLLKELTNADGKTKVMAQLMKKLPLGKSTLVVLPKQDQAIFRSLKNMPSVTCILADSLNILAVLKHATMLLPTASLDVMQKTYMKNRRAT